MQAEIGIDEEGRAYISLSGLTSTEWNTARHMRSFLPLRIYEVSANIRIVGDRLPGSGKATP